MYRDLQAWMAVPRAHANLVAVVTTLMTMAILVAFDEEHPGGGTLLRGRALLVALVHGLFHAYTLRGLKAMIARQMAQAEVALAAYRDPRRISQLDLAAAWCGLFAVAPYVAGL
jgi:hypothetical protein